MLFHFEVEEFLANRLLGFVYEEVRMIVSFVEQVLESAGHKFYIYGSFSRC